VIRPYQAPFVATEATYVSLIKKKLLTLEEADIPRRQVPEYAELEVKELF
jgi:hypothetical protein